MAYQRHLNSQWMAITSMGMGDLSSRSMVGRGGLAQSFQHLLLAITYQTDINLHYYHLPEVTS